MVPHRPEPYDFNQLDPDGETVQRHRRDCADDLSALDIAYTICSEHAVEVWKDGRFVAHIARGAKQLSI